MAAEPAVSVVVANYRRPDLLRACLRSVRPAAERCDEEAETIVVDDGSGDGTLPALESDHPWATFVALPENRGYAGAINAGLERARGEWVLILNNDATVEENAISELLRIARLTPDLGSVAALMLFATGERRGTINSAGMAIDRLAIPHDRLLGMSASAAGTQPVDVFGACGGAAMHRRAMLESIGGFDSSFAAYFEDADVSWRARMAGWSCVLVPGAVVHHHHSATTTHGSDLKYWLVGRNRVRLLAKNATTAHLVRWGLPMLAYDLAYVAYAAVADRTIAPLRGRLRGLAEWRRYRRAERDRRPIEISPAEGLRSALRRRRVWLGMGAVGR